MGGAEQGKDPTRPAQGPHRIAHVDDDPDIRTIVRIALGELSGYEVRSFGGGR